INNMRTTLKKDEKLLILIHQHWIILVMPIFARILLTALLLFTNKLSNSVQFLIIVLAAIYPMLEYIKWKYNLWAVTNMRVIDEEGYFTRYSKESPLDKINNVEYNQPILGRIFGYGDVDIQTAAEMGETKYSMIHHPKLLKDTITLAQEEYKKNQISTQATQLAQAIAKTTGAVTAVSQQMIADELSKLFDLLQKGAITQEEYIAQKAKLMGN
ncbi:MAG: PH domain-containing protein, partial [Ferruginibacter sp.]